MYENNDNMDKGATNPTEITFMLLKTAMMVEKQPWVIHYSFEIITVLRDNDFHH